MRIVVLGSGISGLSTAAELLRARHEVIVVSAAPLTATTSFLAAAVWFPTAAGPADRVRVWSETAFGHLAALAASGARWRAPRLSPRCEPAPVTLRSDQLA
ncbi:FAD-dependent oxidoreductase [Nocardia beijingensis]|uniref:FAD-dependent oxidoreductase n=1 Tax=Nocardia beijingensis TaxID=95162 RepID=UPI00189473A8|nr:FAD-dependent oxidoreductase [Nocardia beijingensis]MBF6468984.1 FAD-dependent oxidoreductase [Nocardia beijingensis]